jgi:RNA polymerase sigma factor (sigma-70 family)
MLEALIRRYQERIARFVIAQTGHDSCYEDLCQTIFVKMVLGLPRLKDVSRFEPWLFQIARNVCRDHLRARKGWRRLFVSYEPEHDQIALPQTPPRQLAEENVALGIARLPDAQREVLQLSLQRPRSYEELAGLSNATVAAVKSRLHRARENLRKMLLAGEPE